MPRKSAKGKWPLSTSRPALLVDGKDREFRAFIQKLFSVTGQFEALRDKIGALENISGAQYGILMAILHHGAETGVPIARLAEHLHLRANFVTTEVNKLHAAGLVNKKDNPDDGRSVLTSLSAKGRTLLELLLPSVVKVNDEIFRETSRSDFETMRRIMSQLVHSLPDAHAAIDRVLRDMRREKVAP